MTRHLTQIGKYISYSDTSKQFKAMFDGQGHKVELTLNRENSSYIGLFGYVGANSLVCNVGVGGSVSGGSFVGGVVGWNYGTVSNCYNTGEVSVSRSKVGGVVGENCSMVRNCYNTGNVSGGGLSSGGVSGTSYIGGLVGLNRETVNSGYNMGRVEGGNYVGGVAGLSNSTSELNNCYNVGIIKGLSSNVGDIVGLIDPGVTVINCYYLTGTATKGVGSGTDTTTSKTEAEMKEASFIEDLNSGLTKLMFAKDDWGLNGGLPVLLEVTYLKPVGKASIGGRANQNIVLRMNSGGITQVIHGILNIQAKPGYKLDGVLQSGKLMDLSKGGWSTTKDGATCSGQEPGRCTVLFKKDE